MKQQKGQSRKALPKILSKRFTNWEKCAIMRLRHKPNIFATHKYTFLQKVKMYAPFSYAFGCKKEK